MARPGGGGVLELDGLTCRFGALTALDDLVLSAVRPGGGVLGPNGAGKTTTMRAIFGLSDLVAGAVRWNGVVIGDAQRRRFGYMPEERGLYPGMLMAEQVEYFGRLHGMTGPAAAASTATWLERLELAERSQETLPLLVVGSWIHRPMSERQVLEHLQPNDDAGLACRHE
jgi:ABC-2 type transport system ATP-binding protein